MVYLLEGKKVGIAITGSFCTFKNILKEIEILVKDEKADVYHQENRKCQPEAGFYGVNNRLDVRAVSGEKQQAYKENINR